MVALSRLVFSVEKIFRGAARKCVAGRWTDRNIYPNFVYLDPDLTLSL